MKFIPNYPIENLKPADYNPRKINIDSFKVLIDSIKRFGLVKPIILNGTGILTAGHQRVRACKEIGIKEVPAILLDNISLHDEIKFNLFHNSIETNKSNVTVKNFSSIPHGYSFIEAKNFLCGSNQNAPVTKSIADLYLRYGNWGSIVIDEEGNVILNSDYVIAMKMFNEPVLTYKLKQSDVSAFLSVLNKDFGVYNYSSLNIKPYVQYHCQMNRIKNDFEESLRSSLYEKYVIPNLKKTQRIIDFGAGKFVYVDFLKTKGYKILGYEPYFKKNNHQINISKVIYDIELITKDITINGLYDVVVLDSVLNSITSLDYERLVLITCNSLMKSNGVLYIATRCYEKVEREARAKLVTRVTRTIEFLDNNGFSATFRQGNWTLQKFHTANSLKELLVKYFDEVEVKAGLSQNYAICKKPKAFDSKSYEGAIDVEFNMEYPNNFRHNKHENLKRILLQTKRIK